VPFPDVEDLLVAALTDLVADAQHIGTRTPPDLQSRLDFIRIHAGGGPRDQVNAHTRVDVQVFSATRASGLALAEQLDDYLTQTRLSRVDRIVCESGPQEVPWPDPTTRTWIAIYRVVTRRRA
jgi:hypothetical protein